MSVPLFMTFIDGVGASGDGRTRSFLMAVRGFFETSQEKAVDSSFGLAEPNRK
jgi:hypothetical protein